MLPARGKEWKKQNANIWQRCYEVLLEGKKIASNLIQGRPEYETVLGEWRWGKEVLLIKLTFSSSWAACRLMKSKCSDLRTASRASQERRSNRSPWWRQAIKRNIIGRLFANRQNCTGLNALYPFFLKRTFQPKSGQNNFLYGKSWSACARVFSLNNVLRLNEEQRKKDNDSWKNTMLLVMIGLLQCERPSVYWLLTELKSIGPGYTTSKTSKYMLNWYMYEYIILIWGTFFMLLCSKHDDALAWCEELL